ncbi:MAG: hypothetical protein ABTR27_11825 [Candidatus Competibacter phosphatis]
METTKRNPDGLISKKPIALRLMPAELANAKRVSQETNVSMSCLAREAFLKGLPLVDFSTSAPTPSADFPGGESSSLATGLSTLAA